MMIRVLGSPYRLIAALVIIMTSGLAADSGVARAVQSAPGRVARCSELQPAQIRSSAIGAEPLRLQMDLRYLPGGRSVEVRADPPRAGRQVYCALFEGQSSASEVPLHQRDDTTFLQLNVPSFGLLWPETRELTLVSFSVQTGEIDTERPVAAAVRSARVTSGAFSFVVALAATAVAYVLAALVLGRGGKRMWSPIVVTAGHRGKASLSKLQIFGFTLLVFYLLVFILLRTGVLVDISQDVLLLLGISAVGAGGGKLAAISKKRLDFDNWAWLCENSWLRGCDEEPKPESARYGDLLTSGSEFDVYKFQLAVVSIVVAGALLLADLSALASFEIPQNLLGLLGLSNVVYIGGKAVAPGVAELNDKVAAVRDAELRWRVAAKGAGHRDLGEAISGQPAEYEKYLAAAREAAVMVRSFFGAANTKFERGKIDDAELEPAYP